MPPNNNSLALVFSSVRGLIKLPYFCYMGQQNHNKKGTSSAHKYLKFNVGGK